MVQYVLVCVFSVVLETPLLPKHFIYLLPTSMGTIRWEEKKIRLMILGHQIYTKALLLFVRSVGYGASQVTSPPKLGGQSGGTTAMCLFTSILRDLEPLKPLDIISKYNLLNSLIYSKLACTEFTNAENERKFKFEIYFSWVTEKY